MDKKTKTTMLLIAFAVTVYAAVMNLGAVLGFVGKLISLLLPLIIGLVGAFVLSVPMNGFERLLKKLFKNIKRPPREKLITVVSFFLTLAVLLLIVLMVVTMLIPQLVDSVRGVVAQVQQKVPFWLEVLNSHNVDTARFKAWFDSVNSQSLMDMLSGSAGLLLSSVKNISTTLVSLLINAGLGLVVMVYVLLGKKQLKHMCRRVLYAYVKKESADRIVHIALLSHQTFSKFLSGQCLEACILGSIIFIAFSVAGLPYAGLIAVLTAFCAFIPYVGALLSFSVGTLLTLLSSPSQALLCIIVYLAVQFTENQFIYPNVVGSSVGLPPLFTLLAVMLGGKLLGLLGMIFFIPLMAVVYALVQEDVQLRDERRPIPKNSKFSP